MPTRPTIVPVIRLTTLTTLAAVLGVAAPAAGGRYVGKVFPNFSAKDAVTEDRFSLDDYRGKVVLIDFWATWCGPCVRELPHVQGAYERFHDQGFEVISISLDKSSAPFRRFIKSNEMPWRHVMEGGGWNTRLAREYGIKSIPAMFILDHEGRCISDSARGKALERTVERAVSRIPAPSEGPTTGTDAAPASRTPRRAESMSTERAHELLVSLKDTQVSMAAVRPPLDALQRRVGLARRANDQIRSELPAPADPDGTMQAWTRLQKELVDIRLELFVHGVLQTRMVALPPPAAAGSPVGLIKPTGVANVALMAMQSRIDLLVREVNSLESEMRRVSRGLMSRTPELALAERTEKIQADVRSLEQRLEVPWRSQLAVADRLLLVLREQAEEIGAQLTSVDAAIAECRGQLGRRSRDTTSARALGTTFSKLCDDLSKTCRQVGQTGLVAWTPSTLPANPLSGGRMSVRERTAAIEQLDLAAEITAGIRDSMARQLERLSPLEAELRVLQRELTDAGDQARLTDLERRFRAVSRHLLAVADG